MIKIIPNFQLVKTFQNRYFWSIIDYQRVQRPNNSQGVKTSNTWFVLGVTLGSHLHKGIIASGTKTLPHSSTKGSTF